MNEQELRAAIEAIIFVSGEPVKPESLEEAFSEEGAEAVQTQIIRLEEHYRESGGGFYLERAAGGLRFATRAEYDPFLRKFFAKQNEGRLSLAALETLAIIAYRQPVTAPEISDIRGVNTSGVLRTLLERKMIRIAGRKNVVGSPFLYRTTRDFLMHFGLNEIQDLPRLEEFTEILGENVAEELLAAMEQDHPIEAAIEEAESSESIEITADSAQSESESVDEKSATEEASASVEEEVESDEDRESDA